MDKRTKGSLFPFRLIVDFDRVVFFLAMTIQIKEKPCSFQAGFLSILQEFIVEYFPKAIAEEQGLGLVDWLEHQL